MTPSYEKPMIFANALDGMFLRSQRGEVISYSMSPVVLVLLVAIGVLLLGFSWYLRRSPDPRRIILGFAGCMMILFICPSIAFDKIIVTPDFFEKQEWSFISVTTSRYAYNKLTSLRVRQEEKVASKGNIPYRLYHQN